MRSDTLSTVHGEDMHDNLILKKQHKGAQSLAFFVKHQPYLIVMKACGSNLRSSAQTKQICGRLAEYGLIIPQRIAHLAKQPSISKQTEKPMFVIIK
jgi:hypothetical protein